MASARAPGSREGGNDGVRDEAAVGHRGRPPRPDCEGQRDTGALRPTEPPTCRGPHRLWEDPGDLLAHSSRREGLISAPAAALSSG